jgi:hypothetical protein
MEVKGMTGGPLSGREKIMEGIFSLLQCGGDKTKNHGVQKANSIKENLTRRGKHPPRFELRRKQGCSNSDLLAESKLH